MPTTRNRLTVRSMVASATMSRKPGEKAPDLSAESSRQLADCVEAEGIAVNAGHELLAPTLLRTCIRMYRAKRIEGCTGKAIGQACGKGDSWVSRRIGDKTSALEYAILQGAKVQDLDSMPTAPACLTITRDWSDEQRTTFVRHCNGRIGADGKDSTDSRRVGVKSAPKTVDTLADEFVAAVGRKQTTDRDAIVGVVDEAIARAKLTRLEILGTAKWRRLS